jgi:predicted nucleotidyltransferase
MDFLVALDPKTLRNLMNLQALLEDLFQSKIDVVLEENLRDELRPYVLPETQYVKGL